MANLSGPSRLPECRTRRLTLLFAAALTMIATPAAATPTGEPATAIDLTYKVYGGGLLILSLDTRAELGGGRYEIASKVATEGLVDRLFHGRLTSRAHGFLTGAGPQMERYVQAYKGRFGDRSIDMTLAADGTYDVEARPEDGDEIEQGPLDPKAAVGAVDPLTASIHAALTGAEAPCASRVPVFDGRRVYELDFSMLATDRLEPRAAGEFAGAAWRCKVVYKPKSGFTREWHIRRAKDPLRPATVWLARFDGGNGADDSQSLMLPVRVQVESAYFNAVAHLTHASIDGRQLIASTEDFGD